MNELVDRLAVAAGQAQRGRQGATLNALDGLDLPPWPRGAGHVATARARGGCQPRPARPAPASVAIPCGSIGLRTPASSQPTTAATLDHAAKLIAEDRAKAFRHI